MFSNKLARSIAAGAAAIAVAVGGVAVVNSNSSNGSSGTATAAQTAAPAQTTGTTGTGAPAHGPGAAGQTGPPSQGGAPRVAAGAGAFGQAPAGWNPGTGTIITGAAADKAKAAAIAANYTGTVNRVLQLSDGSYVVHIIGSTGVHHVFVSTAFKVVAAE